MKSEPGLRQLLVPFAYLHVHCTCTCTYRYCEHVRYVVQVRGNAEGTCDTDLHEEEPRDMTVGISIHNLLKIYDDVSTCTPRARHLLSMVYI